jgi:hypothetical protein
MKTRVLSQKRGMAKKSESGWPDTIVEITKGSPTSRGDVLRSLEGACIKQCNRRNHPRASDPCYMLYAAPDLV